MLPRNKIACKHNSVKKILPFETLHSVYEFLIIMVYKSESHNGTGIVLTPDHCMLHHVDDAEINNNIYILIIP